MNFELTIIIKAILLGWFLTNFTPWQQFLNAYVKPHIPAKLSYLRTLLSCIVCMSFHITWITALIITGKFLIYDAILASVITYTYERIINSFKQYF